MIGAIIRQGPHQGAQQSTRTGLSARRTIVSKVASVMVIGLSVAPALSGMGSFCPHLPQTGWRVLARSSTRFFAPQLGQAMIGIGPPVDAVFIKGAKRGGGKGESPVTEVTGPRRAEGGLS